MYCTGALLLSLVFKMENKIYDMIYDILGMERPFCFTYQTQLDLQHGGIYTW